MNIKDQIGRMTAQDTIEAFQDLLAAMNEDTLREAIPGCNRKDREILFEALQDFFEEEIEIVDRRDL